MAEYDLTDRQKNLIRTLDPFFEHGEVKDTWTGQPVISIGDNITQTMSAEDAGAIEQLGINDSILLSQLADAEKDPSEDNVKKLLPLATTKSRGKASSALPPSFSSSSILKLAYP